MIDRYTISTRPFIQPEHLATENIDLNRPLDPFLASIEKLQAHYRIKKMDGLEHRPVKSRISSRTMSLNRQEASPNLLLKHPKTDRKC